MLSYHAREMHFVDGSLRNENYAVHPNDAHMRHVCRVSTVLVLSQPDVVHVP